MDKNVTHTPGPWRVTHEDAYFVGLGKKTRGVAVVGVEERMHGEWWGVAVCLRNDEADAPPDEVYDQIDAEIRDIQEANARLIAKAPELYDLAKAYVAMAERMWPNGIGRDGYAADDLYNRAKRLIRDVGGDGD